MKRRYFFIGVFFVVVCVSCHHDNTPVNFSHTVQLWIEPEAGDTPILQAIDQAQSEIDVVMYLFTDRKIADALAKAAERGVTVKALIEKAPYQSTSPNDWLNNFWQGSGIQWHWVPASTTPLNFYHQKTMLIDHQQAWIMTANFVYSSFSRKNIERNFILLDQDPQDVNAAEKLFQQDWRGEQVTSSATSSLVISPLNSRQQLEGFIAKAKTHVEIYAEGLSDYDFIGALAEAARRGVSVQVIYGGTLQDKAKQYLVRHGVQVYQATTFVNHAKAILVDDQWVYIGSANFTQNSFDHNRELGVIVNDKKIAQQFAAQFSSDCGYGRAD